jgi:hypothetical protein
MSGDQKVTSDNGKHASGSAEEARKSDQSMADAIQLTGSASRDSGSAALDVATINTRKLLIELEIERILPVFTGDTGKLNGVRFYLQDLQEPVVIDQPVISMGRADPAQNIHPALDLTLHYGLQLGVSRYHAEITHSHSRYFIKDFGSTNGTWINNHRIPTYQQIPIYSGDQIRLGHLALVVRFPQV